MLPPAFSSTPESYKAREFEELIQHAILAIRNGNRSLGMKLLNQAAQINAADARIWIWLSATTDDAQQRRAYLENALAVDPSNELAKRGLQRLSGAPEPAQAPPASPEPQSLPLQPDLERQAPEPVVENAEQTPELPPEPSADDGTTATYTCPNCGGSISFSIHESSLVCPMCGFTRKVDQHVVRQSAPQVHPESLSAPGGANWVAGQARYTCEQCRAVILLPTGQAAETCPYCASTRFVTAPELMDLVDPALAAPFQVDPQAASSALKTWLGKGLLAPDELAVRHAGMMLRPAYYPFWLLSGTLEIPWFCDLNVGSGNVAAWEARTGTHSASTPNLLVSALRRISMADMAELEPFRLEDLAEFSADALEDFPVLASDLPLSDASLLARERVITIARDSVSAAVEPGLPRRNFKIGPPRWSELASKLVLLPIYTGNYLFQGKRYRLLVNGQTGKVSGKKPIDMLKGIMLVAAGIILLVVIITIIRLLSANPAA